MTFTRRELLLAGSGAFVLAGTSAHASGRREAGEPRLMQGPMLGAVEPRGLRVWARSSEEAALTLQVSRSASFDSIVAQATQRATAAQDLTAVLHVEGLEPRSDYFYRVLVNGAPDPYLGKAGGFPARTAPATGEAASFSVAFGSCARYARDSEQPIWKAVRSHAPDMFLWLGDNIYGDSTNPGALAEEYRRQRDVSAFRPLGRSVPQLAIWDDHDYGLNNHDRSNPVRDAALAAFRTYWANPSYGLPDVPGVFFRYRYGAVDFFMLDGRYYRDPNDAPDVPGKTLLGAAQLSWLKQELKASNAVFKVLACGSGWSKAKGPGGDSWSAFLHERDALFEFIRQQKIGGVVLLSGDTHVGELNAIPWSDRGGYDFYDLVSSPLAQECGDEWPKRSPEITIRPVHARSANFGLLRFELAGEPRLSYQLMDVDGKPAWSALQLTARQLRNGQASWRDVIDPALQHSQQRSA